MAPRASTPRAKPLSEQVEDDAFDTVISEDNANVAKELSEAFEQLRSFTGSEVKGHLYQIPRGGGKLMWVKDISPPFDGSEIMEDLKEEYGPGSYVMRITIRGKIQKTVPLDIAGKPKGTTDKRGDNMDFLQIMMAQSDRSRTEQQSMMQMMMQQQQAQQQMMMTMMQGSSQQMMALVTAMMTGKSDPTDLAVKMAELMKPSGGGMQETLGMLVTAKELFANNDSGGGDPDSLMGLAGKLLPGMLTAGAEMAKNIRPQEKPQQLQVLPHPDQRPMTQQPNPNQVHLTQGPQVELTETDKLLAMFAPDMLFSLSRGHTPEAAASLVLDTLDKNEVSEDAISQLVVQFVSLGEQWPLYLKERGIDVTGHEKWFNEFITHVIAGYQDDDSGGDAGGEGNLGAHEDPGDRGQNEHAGSPTGA